MTDRIGASSPQAPLTSLPPRPWPEQSPAPSAAEPLGLPEQPFTDLSDEARANLSIESLYTESAGPRHLNLSLPANFNDSYDFSAPDLRFPDFNSPARDAEPTPAMTRRELVDNARSSLRDAVGDGAATVLEGALGLAHIANGGKVRLNTDTSGIAPNSSLRTELSTRRGGEVNLRWQMRF